MREWFRKRLGIRRDERVITALMFTYIFGVLMFYYILKPLRAGLFLKSFPAEHLPYAYLLTAFLAGSIATFAFKAGRRLSVIAMLTWTNIAIAGTLVVIRGAMATEFGHPSLPYIYFVYVQIVSVLASTQFWLLASEIYDGRQAKRIYGLLGSGAILGAMAGSIVPGFLSGVISTDTMILIAVAISLVLIGVGHAAWRYRDRDAARTKRHNAEVRDSLPDLARAVVGSRHVMLMVILILSTLVASQIAEWQLSDTTQHAVESLPKEQQEAEINRFFGRFYFVTNVLGILIQILFTGQLVGRFGILGNIVWLPGTLFAGSVLVLAIPSIWSAAIARAGDAVFRHSLNRAGLELLYLPLTPDLRKRLKVFVDVFVDRAGRALAGIFILAATSPYLNLGVQGTAFVAMLCALGAILACLGLRRSYADAYRNQILRREIDVDDLAEGATAESELTLLETLRSGNERQILFALDRIQVIPSALHPEHIETLLQHESGAVRTAALKAVRPNVDFDRTKVLPLLKDREDTVRFAALDLLCATDCGGHTDALRVLLQDPDTDIRLTALRWAAEKAGPGFAPTLRTIEDLLETKGGQRSLALQAAAGMASRLDTDESRRILDRLLHDHDPGVAQSAILSVASSRNPRFIELLLPLLVARSTRGLTRDSLTGMGASILPLLREVLESENTDIAVKREIPWVISRIDAPASAETLLGQLRQPDRMLRYRAVKGLGRLHHKNPTLLRGRNEIAEYLYRETRQFYEVFADYTAVKTPNGETGEGLLERALREKLDQELEIIFRLLGLQYPQVEIHSAFIAFRSSRHDRRVAAIEFLDTVLQPDLKALIVPLLEDQGDNEVLSRASRVFGIQVPDRETAIQSVLKLPDTWLRACALYEIGRHRMIRLRNVAEVHLTAADHTVRSAAEWSLAHLPLMAAGTL